MMDEQYKFLPEIDRILFRSGMYIGSINRENTETYILKDNTIQLKKIDWCPGLYKIIDELIVNAMDHAVRTRESKTPVTEIIITMNSTYFSIKNIT